MSLEIRRPSYRKPIETTFLILTPAGLPDLQVRILGLAGRAALDRQLAQHLSSSKDAEELLAAIRNSEMIHNAPEAKQGRESSDDGLRRKARHS